MAAKIPKDYAVEADEVHQHSPQVHSHAHHGGSIVQVELGASKPLIVLLWMSAFFSAAAAIGLIAAIMFIRGNIGYTAVLQYDLFDLRAKTGHAHENTPEPHLEGEGVDE